MDTLYNSPENVIKRITSENFSHYARLTGWIRAQDIGDKFIVYRLPENDTEELLIPKNQNFLDYPRRIAEAITLLSSYEQRSEVEIITDILISSPSDVLRFKVEGMETADGTIEAKNGINFFSGLQKSLKSSAYTLIAPKKFYRYLNTEDVESFFNTCRIGQTERGSFVVPVICPLYLTDYGRQKILQFYEMENNVTQDTFTRKVTSNLMLSIKLITECIDNQKVESLTKPNDGVYRVSANFCEGLLDMQPSSDESKLHISAKWVANTPIGVPSSVTIEKKHFYYIEKIADELSVDTDDKPVEYKGVVHKLEGKYRAEELSKGEIVIEIFRLEGNIDARVKLNVDDYRNAIDAHKQTKTVRVTGRLEETRRGNRILEPKNFKIIT